jgi:phosphohistidine phosphatase
MDLFVVRHAIAVPRGESSLDHARPLTEEGRTRFSKAARGLGRLGADLDIALHSPWVRARQTAELLVERVGGKMVETERLARTPSAELLAEAKGDAVAFVGHEPWMGELVSLLVFGDTSRGDSFAFKKGGVAHLTGTPKPGGCTLVALYTPKALRAAAK